MNGRVATDAISERNRPRRLAKVVQVATNGTEQIGATRKEQTMSEEVMIPKSYHDKVCENIIRFKDKQFYDAVHLLDDGTLEITVEDYTKVKRVLVEDDNNWGNLFYEDGADRPQGEWTEKTTFHNADDDPIIEKWQSAKCSVCGKYHTTPYLYYFDDYNYCPNCGSRMRGGKDD